MKTVNSFTLGPNLSDEGSLPQPVSFPEKQVCTRVRMEAKIPVLNSTGGSVTLTNAQAVDLMTKFFGSIRLSFGKEQEEVVDAEVTFARYRRMHAELTGRDVLFNGKELRNYQSTDSNAIVIANTATVTVVCECIRPFVYDRFAQRELEWCPGRTQMQQMQLKIIRGGALSTANLAQSGQATVNVSVDHEDGPDKWSNVPRLKRNTTSGLEQVGPSGGLLAMWEESAIGEATALQIITLERQGDTPLHAAADAKRIARDMQLKNPIGGFDIGALDVTLLYRLEAYSEFGGVPTSTAFKLIQGDSYIATMTTDWLYVPNITESYRDDYVGKNVTSEKFGAGREVLGVSSASFDGKTPSTSDAAIASVTLLSPMDEKYQITPGRLFQRGLPAQTHIPEGLQAAVKAAVGSKSGHAATSHLAREAKTVATYIPGATSPQRGGVTSFMNNLPALLTPNGALTGGAAAFMRSFHS